MSPSYHERKIQLFINAKQRLSMCRFKSLILRKYKCKSLIWNYNFLFIFLSFKYFPLLVITFPPPFILFSPSFLILPFSGSNHPSFPSSFNSSFSGSNRPSFPNSFNSSFLWLQSSFLSQLLILPFSGSNHASFPSSINSSFTYLEYLMSYPQDSR